MSRKKRDGQRRLELMAGIELWMGEEATRERLGDAGVYRIHLNEAESHYVGFTHPVIDPGEPGLRFSFCSARQAFCYNCLLRTQRKQVVLKVMTSNQHGDVYWAFWDIKSAEDVFKALTETLLAGDEEPAEWVVVDG